MPRLLRAIGSLQNQFLHFLMNESLGSIVYDRSGNLNHGTIYGASWAAKALSFDGINDYVFTPEFGTIYTAPAIFNNDYTFMCWVKTSDAGWERTILTFAYGRLWGDALCMDAGDVVWYSDLYGGTTWIIGVTNIKDGKWHHLCGTRIRDGRDALYIDGVFDADDADPGGDHTTGYTHFSVGGDDVGRHPILAEIKDCRIYTRALSAEEIRRIYLLEKVTIWHKRQLAL